VGDNRGIERKPLQIGGTLMEKLKELGGIDGVLQMGKK
jgi:hypothetical protein